MITIYKVHNPYTGLYVDVDTVEELHATLAAEAWRTYMIMTHGQPFSVITINTDGSQVWNNPRGEQIPSPEDIEKIIGELSTSEFTTEEHNKLINGE